MTTKQTTQIGGSQRGPKELDTARANQGLPAGGDEIADRALSSGTQESEEEARLARDAGGRPQPRQGIVPPDQTEPDADGEEDEEGDDDDEASAKAVGGEPTTVR